MNVNPTPSTFRAVATPILRRRPRKRGLALRLRCDIAVGRVSPLLCLVALGCGQSTVTTMTGTGGAGTGGTASSTGG